MRLEQLKVYPERDRLPRDKQLAWKIAETAADPVEVEPAVAEMVVNRIIDNAAVAIAAVNRRSVTSARDMALAHPRPGGATVFGVGLTFECMQNGPPGLTAQQFANWTTTTLT